MTRTPSPQTTEGLGADLVALADRAITNQVHPVNWSYWVRLVMMAGPARDFIEAASPERIKALADAARLSVPSEALAEAILVATGEAGRRPTNDGFEWYGSADELAAAILAALPYREDAPEGLDDGSDPWGDVWNALDRLVPAYPEDDDDMGEIRRIVSQRQDARAALATPSGDPDEARNREHDEEGNHVV